MMQSRTHNCGELRAQHAGEHVKLVGWMENVREVGGSLAFVVLRDFYGTTQIVVRDERAARPDQGLQQREHHLRRGHRARAREQEPQSAHRRH